MEWLVVLLAGGAAGSYVALKLRRRADQRRERAAELDLLRTLAAEDVRAFGDEIERLGGAVAASDVAYAARQDHQAALDIHADARSMVEASTTATEVSDLIATLARGHHVAACVRAQLAGEPAPERTLPCFFKPQHGPSSRKVTWTSPRSGTHTVRACAWCASRLDAGEKPEVRTVSIGAHRARRRPGSRTHRRSALTAEGSTAASTPVRTAAPGPDGRAHLTLRPQCTGASAHLG